MTAALVPLVLLAVAPVAQHSPPPDLCVLHPLSPTAGRYERGLAVDGDRLAATVTDGDSVEIEIFERTGPTWVSRGLVGTLSGGNLLTAFGEDLDLELGSLIASAPHEGLTTGGVGVLRPFRSSPVGWIQLPVIRSNHPEAMFFGDAFDRAGDVLAVHSSWPTFATVENHVHVFIDNGQRFVEDQTLDDPNPAPPGPLFSGFGAAIALDGPWLVIGAPRSQSGLAYVWQRTPAGYVYFGELDAPGARSSRYGEAVAASNGLLAIADPGAPSVIGATGAVHLFELDPATQTFLHAGSIGGLGGPGAASLGESLELDGRTLAASFRTSALVGVVSYDGIVVIEEVGTPNERRRELHQGLLAPHRELGRTLRLARGELLTTDRSRVVGNAYQLVDTIGRYALFGPSAFVCQGQPNTTGQRVRAQVVGCEAAFDGLQLEYTDLPGGAMCVPLIGTGTANLPIGQGFLCIGAPQRAGVEMATLAGRVAFDYAPRLFGYGAGDVVLVQAWYRDGATSNLSDTLAVELTD